MLTMDVSHPDIIKFINSKDDLTKVTAANISVKITDEFMQAVKDNTNFNLKFKDYSININAKKIWDEIIKQAWKSAEPGVLFWDRIIEESPADCYKGFQTISTNPCGELPLCAYDSCRLGSIILPSFVDNPFTNKATINIKKLQEVAYKSQKLMDDVNDLELEKVSDIIAKIGRDPEPFHIKERELDLWVKIQDKLISGRRTGLGITGLGDMLAMLNLKYGTDEANDVAEGVMKTIAIKSYESSIDMARDRGAFPIWSMKAEEHHPYLDRILSEVSNYDTYKKHGRRNIANLTIAPTGSMSILTQTTSGAEPVFTLKYTRRVKTNEDDTEKSFKDDTGVWWKEYDIYHKPYRNWLKYHSGISEICPYDGATANEINPIKKVEMQGRLQKWIDHSISITHNLPKSVTIEDVDKIYMKAWEVGCKGCTIYRDGSRSGILVVKDKEEGRHAPKRPKSLSCEIFTPTIKGVSYLVVVGLLNNSPYEIFATKNKWSINGTYKGEIIRRKSRTYDLSINNKVVIENIAEDMLSDEEDKCRLASAYLRHQNPLKFLVEQLNKSKGSLIDFSKVLARILKKYINDGESANGETCPECGLNEFVYSEGCLKCKSCNYTKC